MCLVPLAQLLSLQPVPASRLYKKRAVAGSTMAVVPPPRSTDATLHAKHEPARDQPENSSSPPGPTKAVFEPGWRFYAIFTTLCIITIAAALDATSLSVALPVRQLPSHQSPPPANSPRSSPTSSMAQLSRPFGPAPPSCSAPPSSSQPLHPYPTLSAASRFFSSRLCSSR